MILGARIFDIILVVVGFIFLFSADWRIGIGVLLLMMSVFRRFNEYNR